MWKGGIEMCVLGSYNLVGRLCARNQIVLVLLIGMLLGCGPSDMELEGTTDTRAVPNLEELLSEASSLSVGHWKQMTKSPFEGGVSDSLTSVAMQIKILSNEGDMKAGLEEWSLLLPLNAPPDPSVLERALTGKKEGETAEYYSVIRPELIKQLTCEVTGDKAHGVVSVFAEGAFQAKIHFSCQKSNGQWKVTEFYLPVRKIRTAVEADGKWRITEGREKLDGDADQGEPKT
jgi:hypothetical protein